MSSEIEQPKKRHLSKKAKTRLVAAACCVIPQIVLLCGLAYRYYQNKIALLQYSDGVSSGEAVSKEEATADEEAMAKAMEGLEARDAVMAEGDVQNDNDVFNVLLIGTDERTRTFSDNARGDSCMLLSINKKTMQVHLISFERGIGVPILDGPYKGQWDWLTHTFRYGGAALMMREIEENFKVQVDYYARANIYTFMQMIDAVGGVDVELTQGEADYINHPEGTYAEEHIREMGIAGQVQRVTAGPNHLNGATAMLYARCRWIDDDWHRVQRQRNVLESMMHAAKGLDPGGLNAMLDAVLPYIQTNVPESEITSLLLAAAPKLTSLTMEQMTVPAAGTYGCMVGMEGRDMYAVDFNTNAEQMRQAMYG